MKLAFVRKTSLVLVLTACSTFLSGCIHVERQTEPSTTTVTRTSAPSSTTVERTTTY